MSEPRVLCFIPKKPKAAHLYRLALPLQHLEANGHIEVKYAVGFEEVPHEDWQWCTHIYISRVLPLPPQDVKAVSDACKKTGRELIVDIDDWWVLPFGNPSYNEWKRLDMGSRIEWTMKHATKVVCTSKNLYKKVKRYNRNTYVIPNAIDTSNKNWSKAKTPSNKVRFGYMGASSHRQDLIHSGIDLTGYEGYTTAYDGYAEAINAKHELDYKPFYEFPKLYEGIDVSLIPLMATDFNRCKSHLKLIEAGFSGTAVICSPVAPYAEYLKPGINCLTASKAGEWKDAIKKLSWSKQMVQDLAGRLSEDMAGYSLDKINELRLSLFE